MIGANRFIEVFVDTPLDVCETRDAKGMYKLARDGKLKNFTGIDDPYEPPHSAELTIDTVNQTPRENAARILAYLKQAGFIADVLPYETEREESSLAVGQSA